jgi:N6-adenosine-specific RNA methylase IME4
MFPLHGRDDSSRNLENTGGNPSSSLTALCAADQRFGCLYADPPWHYTNTRTRGAAASHYPTMPLLELAALPVPHLAAAHAHLHLWTTNAMLHDALHLMAHWGFTYKTYFVWCKPHFGTGNYWRNATELLLLGVKGTLPFRDKGQRNWFTCGRGAHSRKPDQVRQLIERVSPGPYLELFAREQAPGWTTWGNESRDTLWTLTQKESPHAPTP